MRSMLKNLSLRNLLGISLSLAGMATVVPNTHAFAQAPTAANRVVGTITAAGNGVLTVKTDAGVERKVTVPEGVQIQRIAPGEKDLSKAAVIQFTDLAVGDRVLARLAPEPATDPVTAISIVAIPQADLAQKQQKDRDEWQRNGVGGLVKSVDPGTGLVVITSGAGATQKTITLHTTPATILRRYAPDSVDYNQAKAAPLEVIQPGDQLRARGAKSPDGLELAAAEVVSGSFRNISGTISSINKADSTLTLKDLTTKQTVTVHVGADAQMRKLPDTMAKTLAAMTQPGAGAAAGGNAGAGAAAQGQARPQYPTNNGQTSNGQAGNQQAGNQPAGGQAAAQGGNGRASGGVGGGMGSDNGQGRRGGDLQTMLSRAPAIHLSDLQKGDAVMLVSTQGTTDVTAVTLLAGVEPLLQAPASTQNMLLSNWNMSSGGGEAAQ